jgi:hypothetical protein
VRDNLDERLLVHFEQRWEQRAATADEIEKPPTRLGWFLPPYRKDDRTVESLTGTLIERVERRVRASKQPLLSTTPTPLAIQELFNRIEALEDAVREIALEVERGVSVER